MDAETITNSFGQDAREARCRVSPAFRRAFLPLRGCAAGMASGDAQGRSGRPFGHHPREL